MAVYFGPFPPSPSEYRAPFDRAMADEESPTR